MSANIQTHAKSNLSANPPIRQTFLLSANRPSGFVKPQIAYFRRSTLPDLKVFPALLRTHSIIRARTLKPTNPPKLPVILQSAIRPSETQSRYSNDLGGGPIQSQSHSILLNLPQPQQFSKFSFCHCFRGYNVQGFFSFIVTKLRSPVQ